MTGPLLKIILIIKEKYIICVSLLHVILFFVNTRGFGMTIIAKKNVPQLKKLTEEKMIIINKIKT